MLTGYTGGPDTHSLASIGPRFQSRDSRSMASARVNPADRSARSSLETADSETPSFDASSDCEQESVSNQAENRPWADVNFPGDTYRQHTYGLTNDKSESVKLVRVNDFSDLHREEVAARRWRKLVEELRQEYEGKHGWKKKVAEMAGLSASYFSRNAVSMDRPVTAGVIQRTIERMKLDSSYFFGPVEPKSYKDYIRGKARMGKGLREFLESPFGRTASEEQISMLEALDAASRGRMPAVDFHGHLALMLRSPLLNDDEVHSAVELAKATDEQMKKARKSK
jgi:hypothetical protein